ncbi:hypothetical protein CBR_g46732 [Chara braunii]|uniref:Aminotransferase class I/classII large domain-containing protein n=1 Tax=Chara braunii TaxID=69332 RepID=A0A388K432_CHABU|nr:hypothetical protein CBR_g46732 [Chara braunii]|eukprot:GBG64776.1 hypothetical protein CBR_g46732 [Chara braunii]
MNRVADRLATFGETIFTTMCELASEHDAVDLGPGAPDFDGPDFAKDAAIEAIRSGKGQYSRLQGVPPLNAAIAERFQKDYNLMVDPDLEVTVTCGCSGAIAAAFLGLVNPGDEVVLIEPYYDCYPACAAMAGATIKCVTLRPPSFAIVERELRAAFSPKTRAIVINSPHNPTGRVFSKKEMDLIASLCQEHDSLVLMDQVYEKIVFPGASFLAMAALPGMYPRTVSMSSLGKTFSLTGWKIGWAVAPPPLTDAIRRAHQYLTFSIATPLQWGAAAALCGPGEFFCELVHQYTARREKLVTGLREVGFRVFEPEGAFFVIADHTPLGIADNDITFCKYLIEHVGVIAIPLSSFYSNPNDGKHLVRFAFCKDDDTLSAAISRMKAKLCGVVAPSQDPSQDPNCC